MTKGKRGRALGGPAAPAPWAPPGLAKRYQGERGQWYGEILGRLLTDPRMAAVWRTLRTAWGEMFFDAYSQNFVSDFLEALRSRPEPRKHERARYCKVAAAARRLEAAAREIRLPLLIGDAPAMPKIVHDAQLVALAAEQAAEAAMAAPRIVERDRGSRRTHLIRWLEQYFRDHRPRLKVPLTRADVAVLASVALGDADIDDDDVKEALRQR